MSTRQVSVSAPPEGSVYSLHPTPLGSMRAHWNPRGLRKIEWCENQKSWEISGFEAPFEGSDRFANCFDEALQAYFVGKFTLLVAIPVDCSGWTPFFARVYQNCRAIPAGQTLSYRQLATRSGSPAAARAVGQAMASNRVPIVIPCHRVLATGGGLGGYSGPGGTDTKLRLLALESK